MLFHSNRFSAYKINKNQRRYPLLLLCLSFHGSQLLSGHLTWLPDSTPQNHTPKR